MNLLQKTLWYIRLKRKNYRNAFITAFCNNKLTDGDKYFLILLACLILSVLTLKYSEVIDNTIAESEKRAYDAKNAMYEAFKQLNHREKTLVTFLNGDYVRIDNRLMRVKLCDAAGECNE